MYMVKDNLLKIAALLAIPFILFYLLAAELYLDLTNLNNKGQNKKDG